LIIDLFEFKFQDKKNLFTYLFEKKQYLQLLVQGFGLAVEKKENDNGLKYFALMVFFFFLRKKKNKWCKKKKFRANFWKKERHLPFPKTHQTFAHVSISQDWI